MKNAAWLFVIVASWGVSAVAAQTLDTLKGQLFAEPAAKAAAFKPALPNFAEVSVELYRSGQPTQDGVAQLAAKSVKTILKLNTDEPDEASWAGADGITLIPQLMNNHRSPSYDEVDQALATIKASPKPVLVHCHRGKDRTGAVVAAYRVKVQGWSVEKAAQEALDYGYSAPGFDDIHTWLTGYAARGGS